MKQYIREGLRLRARCLLASILILFPVAANPADVQTVPGQGTSSVQAGKVLTLEDVVRIAIENHSSIKSAQFQIRAQDAVMHQQMAAYYPTVNFNNFYRTSNTISTALNASKGFDTVGSTANVTMTLYNFGKREGSVQSARDTLQATQYAYNVTSNNIVLAVKQAYYGVL